MEDTKSIAKQKVLQQLIDMMDERMIGDLKSKSPKFAKVDIQSDDPELAENLKDKLMDGIKEDDMKDPSQEMSPEDFKEIVNEGEDPMDEQDQEDPADMERLLEMYKKLK